MRSHEESSPKSLDSDENFKLFCHAIKTFCELRTFWKSLEKVCFWGQKQRFLGKKCTITCCTFFWSQRLALLAKVTVFGPKKMALRVAKSKF